MFHVSYSDKKVVQYIFEILSKTFKENIYGKTFVVNKNPWKLVAYGGYLPFCIRFEEDEWVSPISFLATQ